MRLDFIHFLIMLTLDFAVLQTTAQAQDTIQVASMIELQRSFLIADPGTTILLDDGMYGGEKVNISISGTREQPVVIRARNMGKAAIHSPLTIDGDHIYLVGLKFQKQGYLEIDGKGNRVSRCNMNNVESGKWIRVLPGSSNIEIDYNIFEDKQSNLDLARGDTAIDYRKQSL